MKPGITLGETDDHGYNITADPVHVHDLNATILRCLGIDHTRLTFKYSGRNFRLTDTGGRVFQKALAFDAKAKPRTLQNSGVLRPGPTWRLSWCDAS